MKEKSTVTKLPWPCAGQKAELISSSLCFALRNITHNKQMSVIDCI